MQQLLKTLACEHRTKILRSLLDRNGYTCICKMENLIDRDRSVVYRHFKRLETAGLIETRKRDGKVECRVKKRDELEELFQVLKDISKEEVE